MVTLDSSISSSLLKAEPDVLRQLRQWQRLPRGLVKSSSSSTLTVTALQRQVDSMAADQRDEVGLLDEFVETLLFSDCTRFETLMLVSAELESVKSVSAKLV